MTDGVNIVLPIGIDGLKIETENDPNSTNPKALTNASDGSLKHAVNVDYQGGINLRRRKGYQDAFHDPLNDPETEIMHQIFDAAGAVVTDRTWQAFMDFNNGIKSLGRYTYMDNRETKATHGYDLERYTLFSSRDENERYIMLYIDPAAPLTVCPDVNSIITDNPATGDEAIVLACSVADQWIFVYDITIGGVGSWAVGSDIADTTLVITFNAGAPMTATPEIGATLTQAVSGATLLVTSVDLAALTVTGRDLATGVWDIVNGASDGGGGTLAPDPCIPSALNLVMQPANPVISVRDVIGISHTLYWRNPATPYIRQLEYAPLDRSVFDVVDGAGNYCFSDTNIRGSEPGRLSNYEMWGRGGERETYLLTTYGGHYVAPPFAAVPRRWNCGAAGNQPPVGSFDVPYVSPHAVQRRVQIWFPEWYHWWCGINGYPVGGGAEEIGMNYHFAPFIWYHKPYNPAENLRLKFEILNTPLNPGPGVLLTQAVTGATMTVTRIDNSTVVLRVAVLTTCPTVGDTITDAGTGATMIVTECNLEGKTITGTDQNTGLWGLNNITDGGGGTLAPDPATITSYWHEARTVWGLDGETGTWDDDPANTVTDGGVGMNPLNVVIEELDHLDYDEFYAEPCGRFMVKYKDSLFMARIERTYLHGAGYQQVGTPTWTYEPSAYMWSFYGRATGMELGTPPEYPFRVPNEPNERVWGCQAHGGFQLNRHNLFRPADGLAITGLETWNDSLYIMKPTGFGQIWGTYSGNFQMRDLEMSQGPCGAYAWCKADEGIYYVTKKGLYLFDGNGASQNVCLSDLAGVGKIFKDDIDWGNCSDMLTGEIIGVILAWDKVNRQVWISYPKVGEQGGGGENDLPGGTPTRMLVYDTFRRRFTEGVLPFPIDDGYRNPCPGIMLAGKDPTDDDYLMFTHPIGNWIGGNANGRVLFKGNTGYRDNVALLDTGLPDADSGDRIAFNVTTKDYTLNSLDSKLALVQDKVIAYTNGGNIKRRITYNYYDLIDEDVDLTYPAVGMDGYIQTRTFKHKTRVTKSTSGASGWTTVAFGYYHDETDHTDVNNTNPDAPIEFVGHSVTVQGKQGYTK